MSMQAWMIGTLVVAWAGVAVASFGLCGGCIGNPAEAQPVRGPVAPDREKTNIECKSILN